MKLLSNNRWLQMYKSNKLKKKEDVRVFIYIKKSVVKFESGKSTLIEYQLPTGNFFIFADGKHYNKLISTHGNIVGVLQEINGADSHLLNLIKEDKKFSLNGNLITVE